MLSNTKAFKDGKNYRKQIAEEVSLANVSVSKLVIDVYTVIYFYISLHRPSCVHVNQCQIKTKRPRMGNLDFKIQDFIQILYLLAEEDLVTLYRCFIL